jgi:Bacterial Ig-like domain (group 2)
MQVRLVAAGALVAAAMVSACGGSDAPTGPTNGAVPSAPRVTSVAVTSSTMSFITRGQTQQLAAQATLSNGFVENRASTATWASDNTGVATVSSSGLMTIGNEGQVTISATSDGQRGTLQVRVQYAFRTPDPPPGQRLPKPDESALIVQLFNERPDLVARSCQPESGGTGTWEYMEFVVDRLRLKDTRWGFNSRRGVVGDVARDEVAYHWGSGPDDGSRDTYAWDIMVSHCGTNPSPSWQDVSDLGTLWASRGRF